MTNGTCPDEVEAIICEGLFGWRYEYYSSTHMGETDWYHGWFTPQDSRNPVEQVGWTKEPKRMRDLIARLVKAGYLVGLNYSPWNVRATLHRAKDGVRVAIAESDDPEADLAMLRRAAMKAAALHQEVP